MRGDLLEELTSLNRSKKKLRRLNERIEDKKEEIESKMKLLEAASKGAEKTKITLELLEVKMSGFSSAESLISDKQALDRLLESKRDDLERAYSDRRRENQDLWLVMLQGAVEESLEDLQPIIDSHQKDQEEASSLKSAISYLKHLGEKESEPCPTCNQLPEPRDDQKIREDEREIENKASKLEVLLEKLEDNSSILRTREKLSRFRAHRGYLLNSNISNINRLIGEIEDKEAEAQKSSGHWTPSTRTRCRTTIRNQEAQCEALGFPEL